jgi:sulfotransferase family protein
MVVWLASYPRSGNTLLRILLNRAFAIETLSLYDDLYDIGARPTVANIVGHRNHGLDREQFYEHTHRSDRIFFVKTHELPCNDAKAIYVVRDGRAAVVSFHHHHRNFREEGTSLSNIIRGEQWPGAWSSHVDAWVLSGRPNTLVLKYEDLIGENLPPLKRVADFLGLPEPQRVSVDFAELHTLFPNFFRSGSNERNIAELKGNDLDLFWSLQGNTMERMRYSDRIYNRTSAQ